MLARFTMVLIPLVGFAFLPRTARAESGAEFTAKVEALAKAERDLKAREREAIAAFVSECLSKKVGPAALEALEFLEAVDPGNPEWGAQRAQARSLGNPPPGGRSWGSSALRRVAGPAAAAWRDLMKEAQKQGAPRSAARFAGILVTLEASDAAARELLGHVRVKDRWMPRFEAEKARAGAFFDPQWGYTTEEEKKKLAEGRRPRGKAWIAVEEDERTARTPEESAVFEDADVRMVSTFGWDASLAFFLECRASLRRMDDLFGDFFAPPPGKRPLAIFLGRRAADLAGMPGAPPGAAAVSASTEGAGSTFDPGANAVLAWTDAAPADARGDPSLRDRVAADLARWILETSGGNRAGATANLWALSGIEALAASRALLGGGNVEPVGCFKTYRDAAGKFPPLRTLLRSAARPIPGSPEWARMAALCHFLLHADGGKYRIRFLGVVREILTGKPSPDDLPAALRLTADDIEKLLDLHMGSLIADAPSGHGPLDGEDEPEDSGKEGKGEGGGER